MTVESIVTDGLISLVVLGQLSSAHNTVLVRYRSFLYKTDNAIAWPTPYIQTWACLTFYWYRAEHRTFTHTHDFRKLPNLLKYNAGPKP